MPGNVAGVDIPGSLQLEDLPPAATPVNALGVSLYSSNPLRKITADVGSDGTFVLKNVPPGHYSLDLPVPARIRSFSSGSRALDPRGFDLDSANAGPLNIVLSYKTSSLSIDITGIPSDTGKAVALAFPDDPYLTRPYSGTVNPVVKGQTTFTYMPPGQYRVFVVDSECQDDIAYHPLLRDALVGRATAVTVAEDGTTRVSANLLDRETLREATRQVKPDPSSPEGRRFYDVPLRCH